MYEKITEIYLKYKPETTTTTTKKTSAIRAPIKNLQNCFLNSFYLTFSGNL